MSSGQDGQREARATPGRCLVVWLAGTLALLLLLAWLRPDLSIGTTQDGQDGPTFDRLLVNLGAAAASLAAAWLWALTSAVAGLAACGRSRCRVPGLPRRWRRLVLVACGAALIGTGAPAAGAGPGAVSADDRTDARGGPVLAGLPYPDRTGPDEARRCGAQRLVEVRVGDTLWELARRQLPRGPDDVAVTRAWHRLYALNRAAVGNDPDLIHPHLRLRVPCR